MQPSWHLRSDTGDRKYISAAERTRVLEATNHLPRPQKLFVLTLAFTGARISEVLNIRRHQVEHGEITIRTLKRRQTVYRTVQVPCFLTDALVALPVNAAAPGRFWTVHRATAHSWVKRVMTFAQIRGVQASARGFRHGFGVRAVVHGVPLTFVQKWLGHSRATTTAIYLEAIGPEERQIAARMW